MTHIKKILALDLDGTLLTDDKEITPATEEALIHAMACGTEVVISTGRPYVGIPKRLTEIGVKYAITANGAAVYKMPEKECLFSDCFPLEQFLPIARELVKYDILLRIFQNGQCYSQRDMEETIHKMQVNETQKNFFRSVNTTVENLVDFLTERNLPVQKLTANFYQTEDGSYKDRDAVFAFLSADPALKVVNGGGSNLECTKSGVSKAKGLEFLADLLGVSMDDTIAVGDSENDLDIIRAAGIGVAMGNAFEHVKTEADFITLSNEEDGVAYAIKKLGLI